MDVETRSERERHRFECPVCGLVKADATFTRGHRGGTLWLISCFVCKGAMEDNTAYLRVLAERVGAPSVSALLESPLEYVGHLRVHTERSSLTRAKKLPSEETVDRWCRKLFSRNGRAALTWLREERGISASVLRRYDIGWTGKNIVVPLRRGSALVNLKGRRPIRGTNMRSLRGRTAELGSFPLFGLSSNDTWVLLVEGELDCLRGRSAGLPAVSVTLGAGTWRREWAHELRNRRVVVCFDVDAQPQAARVVAALRDEGIVAHQLDLRRLGVTGATADLTDFFDQGGDPRALAAVCRRKLRTGIRGRDAA